MKDNVVRGYFPEFELPEENPGLKTSAVSNALKTMLRHTVAMLAKRCGEDETAMLLKLELESIKRKAR
jgi:hypothetical protein